MRRAILSLSVLLIAVSVSTGQYWKTQRFEMMGGLGTTQFFGDIGGFSPSENNLGLKDITIRQTRYNVSVAAIYRLWKELNVRLNMTYGAFNATDDRGSNITRGFVSTTQFLETALLGEYYFIKNTAENSYLYTRKNILRNRPRSMDARSVFFGFLARFDLYAFGGVGGLGYMVSANEALELRGYRDGGVAFVVPAGIGGKIMMSPELSFGIELGGRYSFSDYLEGYTSQFSKYNDVYYFLNATVTYKFDTTDRRVWGLR